MRGDEAGARVLTARELNRAVLARQLLLEPAPLGPVGVVEHLVGVQAQWPSSPYVGIWTRTTGFSREALERELVAGTLVKATVMRQTLHLVSVRDYALLCAALSETNFPWRSALAERLAPSVRAFAPDLLLVSAGFDAHAGDPLAAMEVSEEGFFALARRCAGLAPRVAAVLEGGYNLDTLPGLVAAAHRGLSS